MPAAREMEQTLLRFRQELGPDGRHFDIDIGLHTGEAVVGFIGSPEHRQDYIVIGDTCGRSRILVSAAVRDARRAAMQLQQITAKSRSRARKARFICTNPHGSYHESRRTSVVLGSQNTIAKRVGLQL